MTLRPCRYCRHKDDCARRNDYRLKLKGLGLTLASFKCEDRTREFPPGTKVTIQHDEDLYPGACEFGIVTGAAINKPMKLVVWLEESLLPNGAGSVIRVFPNRLTPIDGEELVHVCSSCGRPDGYENRAGWWCPECEGMPF